MAPATTAATLCLGRALLEHYRTNRVDPLTKTLIFSDGLTIPRTIELYNQFRALPAGVWHWHQPHQRPGRPTSARAVAGRHQDDPLQRPAGGQAVRHPGKGMCDDENTSPTCARCSTSLHPSDFLPCSATRRGLPDDLTH